MTYSYRDILAAYGTVGVAPGSVVHVTSELLRLADYDVRGGKAVVGAHLRALRELIGPGGTLVAPAYSLNLCNTDVPYDPARTPSHNMGALCEFIRRAEDTRRSFHPFASYVAHGARAAEITEDVARQAFGPHTPEARLIEMNALVLSIGLHPRLTCTAVHQVEQEGGVPYRYTKEYIHPVVREGAVRREPFYRFALYLDLGLKRDRNRRLFDRLQARLSIATTTLDQVEVYAYPLVDFHHAATRIFADDIYVWCKEPPRQRPYRT